MPQWTERVRAWQCKRPVCINVVTGMGSERVYVCVPVWKSGSLSRLCIIVLQAHNSVHLVLGGWAERQSAGGRSLDHSTKPLIIQPVR